jgi:hypothetical protein
MQIVNDEGMLGRPEAMALEEMRMVGRQIFVAVRQYLRVRPWPKRGGAKRPNRRQHRRPGERGYLTLSGSEPAGQRIGDEPAAVAERELRGEQGRPVLGIGGATQEPAGGRYAHRVGDSQDEPADHHGRPEIFRSDRACDDRHRAKGKGQDRGSSKHDGTVSYPVKQAR